MGEDFEDSVDTSSFDDISTDTTDTSSFSDPVDVGSMMDDIPAEPLESFDVEPLDSSFETELPTAEATDIDSLMDGAADTYTTEEVPSDTLDSSGLDPSDLSSDIDDYEMDAGSDIADLMDEAAIESLEDTTMDFDDMNQTTDNNIESLMNEVDTTPDIGAVTTDAKPDVANEGNASEIESLLNAEGVNPSELSDTSENISESIREASSETSDISALMDENDVDDSTKPISEDQEGLPGTFEAQDDSLTDVNGADDIPSNETAEDSDEFAEMMEDRIRQNFAGPNAGSTEYGEKELSALDRMGEYYSSHNYGQKDFHEYSKDPEWRELNNDLLREMGREPIDYSNEETPNIEDIREMFVAAGIPEGSPELEAIMANEQAGIDAIVEAQQSPSPPIDPIDGGASSPPIDPPTDPSGMELSALDRMGEYYSSHNYGQKDFQEYSKDPEWQELNNDLLREMGREPIDYSNEDAPNIEDTREMFVAAGIPEGSQELEAIMANEQAGIDAIVEAQHSSSPPIDPIDGGASNSPIDPTESLEDIGSSNEPVHLTQSDVEEFIENSSDKDALQNLRDGIESGNIQIDVDDAAEGNGTGQDIPQDISEEAPTVTDLPNEINYDEVFEGLDDYDFDGIDYATDTERLDSSLENFDSSTWEGLSLDEQKAAMTDLADYVKDVIGFDNPPEIVYYNNPVDGDYGGYSPGSNTLEVNEYMLYNNEEAADTVAHELWHAYQHQRANNPQSAKDYQYQYGFDNYIRPEDDFAGYQDQLVEAEARAFAQQFKDRLNMKGRRI